MPSDSLFEREFSGSPAFLIIYLTTRSAKDGVVTLDDLIEK